MKNFLLTVAAVCLLCMLTVSASPVWKQRALLLDSLSTDTVSVDTVSVDTVSVDTVSIDTVDVEVPVFTINYSCTDLPEGCGELTATVSDTLIESGAIADSLSTLKIVAQKAPRYHVDWYVNGEKLATEDPFVLTLTLMGVFTSAQLAEGKIELREQSRRGEKNRKKCTENGSI